jgi:hypothetical protein
MRSVSGRSCAWAWVAVFLTGVFFVGAIWLDGATRWTEAERLYLVDYLKSGTRGAMPKMHVDIVGRDRRLNTQARCVCN